MELSALSSIIASIAVLVMSVVIHEVSHGYAAYLLGDPTAKHAGRLTLNPLAHLDWFGSVILPALLAFAGGVIFGWAKPVPYDPTRLRGGRWGPVGVALAGPASNLIIALVCAALVRLPAVQTFLGAGGTQLLLSVVFLNIVLAVFNLLPVPPLDGSKLLFALLPLRFRHFEELFWRYQLVIFIILLFVIFNTNFLGQLAFGLFRLLVGA